MEEIELTVKYLEISMSNKAEIKESEILKIPVIKGKVLGVNVYRGFAALGILTDISQADIYDIQNNPQGTQRDLSPKHAREAYEYVKNNELGFWPEVFLCARKNDVLTFKPVSEDYPEMGILEIDLTKLSLKDEIIISRVDGNHRLNYGNGLEKGFNRIDKDVSFCLSYDLKKDEEIQLFKDINKNQKAMNTSHLDGIVVRLSAEEELKRRNPDLYIAQKLSSDTRSPLHGRIYEGGKKPVGVEIPLRGLRTGIHTNLDLK